MAEEKYNEAIIEFRNVLKIDSGNLQAIREHRNIAHFELGEFQNAYQFLSKARELGSKNPDVSVKLSGILSHRTQTLKKPGQEAEFALQQDPNNLDALLLATSVANTLEELDESIRRLEERKPDFKDVAIYHLALGNLYLRKNEFG